MTKRLNKELNQIKTRLVNLRVEDDAAAEAIRADLFTLVKVTETFDEYLHKINAERFTSQNYIFNTGHDSKIEIFNLARTNLTRIVDQILREIKYGALKPKLLPAPEAISITWLFKNAPLSFWGTAIFILIIVFGLGGLVEQKYGNVNVILKAALHPTENLESEINEKSKKEIKNTNGN